MRLVDLELIDAGGEDTGNDRDRQHLLEYLDKFFADRAANASNSMPDLNRTLMGIIISHPHMDHTRNILAVMQRFKVNSLIDGGDNHGSGIAPLRSARKFAKVKHIRYAAIKDELIAEDGLKPFPDLMSSSQVDLRILAGSRGCENGNNDSLVVLARYKQASFLFTGDAEVENDSECEGEVPEIVEFYKNTDLLDVDVYKVSHHGSFNGTDEDFLRAMSPKISVISAGIHTDKEPGPFHAFQFGHPRETIVSLLEQFTTLKRHDSPAQLYSMNGVRKVRKPRTVEKAVYCTCWDGDIIVSASVSGAALKVETTGLRAF